MAAGNSTDLLMRFVIQREAMIEGESTNEIVGTGGKHDLLKGFRKGFVIEVQSFKFGVGTEPDDGESEDEEDTQAPKGKDAKGKPVKGKAANGKKKKKTSSLGQYKAWRNGELGGNKYPVDVREISFTRKIDKSSMRLIDFLVQSKVVMGKHIFESVSLVKRRSAGTTAAGEAYLRFDFKGVLLTDVSWSGEAEVTETCTFVCRSVAVRYRPQLPNGKLGAAVPGFWSSQPNDRMEEL